MPLHTRARLRQQMLNADLIASHELRETSLSSLDEIHSKEGLFPLLMVEPTHQNGHARYRFRCSSAIRGDVETEPGLGNLRSERSKLFVHASYDSNEAAYMTLGCSITTFHS